MKSQNRIPSTKLHTPNIKSLEYHKCQRSVPESAEDAVHQAERPSCSLRKCIRAYSAHEQ